MKVLYIYVRCYIVCCTFDLIMDMAFYTPIPVSFQAASNDFSGLKQRVDRYVHALYCIRNAWCFFAHTCTTQYKNVFKWQLEEKRVTPIWKGPQSKSIQACTYSWTHDQRRKKPPLHCNKLFHFTDMMNRQPRCSKSSQIF